MFSALIYRDRTPPEWTKIPWDDPEFSRRMLAEHLDQSHDMASRRQSLIDGQVAWIHRSLLGGQPSRVLDVGCGPGFYTQRLSALGHTCTGLDFSPASIDYAREQHPSGDYVLGDVRTLDYGQGYDLVMLIYGELNAFAPEEAAQIVGKAHAALRLGGKLLLEVHPYVIVEREGHAPASWFTAERGLFSDEPYLCLTESSFESNRSVTRFYVCSGDDAPMQTYTTMLQGYSEDAYRQLLRAFPQVRSYPSLTGEGGSNDLFVWVAEKA
ncbi:MAG: class I SAM-dependent methyltransferase [Anaerolineae bacterium]